MVGNYAINPNYVGPANAADTNNPLYPRYMYHPTKTPVRVADSTQEAALQAQDNQWLNFPADQLRPPVVPNLNVYRNVANHNSIPTALGGGPSNWSQFCRISVQLQAPVRYLRPVYPLFYTQQGSASIQWDIELPLNLTLAASYGTTYSGTRTRITFSSNNTYSYAANSTVGTITADTIDLGSIMPAGTVLWFWTCIESSDATPILNMLPLNNPQISLTTASLNEGARFVASTQLGAVAGAGSDNITSATSKGYGPCAILGSVLPTTQSILIHGDSIITGQNNDTADTHGGFGFGQKFLNNLNLPWCTIARPGDGYSFQRTQSNLKYRLQVAALANPTHIFTNMGTNDFVGGGNTSALITTYANTVFGYIRGAISVNAPLVAATILPRASTSSDSYANNQTVAAGFSGGSSNRATFNNLLRSNGLSGQQNYIDPTNVSGIETAVGSGLWTLTGTANAVTADGVHPTPAIVTTIVSGLGTTTPFS